MFRNTALTQRRLACPQLLGAHHTVPVNNLRKNWGQPGAGKAPPSPPSRPGVLRPPHVSSQHTAITFGPQSGAGHKAR